MKFTIVFFILSISLQAWAAPLSVRCPKNPIKGYKFQSTKDKVDRYLDSAKRVTLFVKCFPLQTAADDLIKSLRAEANPKNMTGDAVYFEISTETKSKRVYIVTRKPVIELTFQTRWRNRIWLEPTEDQVAKFVHNKKGPPPTFRKPKPR